MRRELQVQLTQPNQGAHSFVVVPKAARVSLIVLLSEVSMSRVSAFSLLRFVLIAILASGTLSIPASAAEDWLPINPADLSAKDSRKNLGPTRFFYTAKTPATTT